MTTNIEHEPPTSDEMLAYLRGGMSPSEQESFRERLLPYPELIRTLTAEFPAEGARVGDEDYLSDAQFARQWKPNLAPAGRLVEFWPAVAALAAALALVFGSFYWKARTAPAQPQAFSVNAQMLQPDHHSRGAGNGSVEATTVIAEGDTYSLVPVLSDERPFDSYRVELSRLEPRRSLWSMRGVRRTDDGTLFIIVPRSFLGAGQYRLAIFGSKGAREEHINDYTIKVE